MDELMGFVIFILLILGAAVFIFPIIILSQISSLRSEIRYLNNRISDMLMPKQRESTPYVRPETGPTQIRPNNHTVYMPNAPVSSAPTPTAPMPPVQTPPVPSRKEEFKPETKIVEVYQPQVHSIPDLPGNDRISESVPEVINNPHPEKVPASDTKPSFSPMHERAYTPPPVTKKVDEPSFFEKLPGTNWLSKIGIVTLVLGIGFFVKYAIDQDWINEIGRVGIGLFTGGLIIGIAHKLKAKYHVFSSLLVGGGISVFYITITIAFREYELFSQTVAFMMLIAITVFSVLLSLVYDRKELAVFSLLGGFVSPLMVSTGTGNFIVLFSYILILNTGMLVVSYLKKWRVIGIISYVLTWMFFWTWALVSSENQYFNESLFISLFFIQFYLLALFDHFKSEKKISAYQVFLILTNNLFAFAAYLYVFNRYSSDVKGLITISLAVVNAVVMVVLFRNSRIDRNLVYLIVAIVLSFVSLAIPIQLKGHVITMFWAAESVILLWLWQKSQIKVFYAGFALISLLTLFSYLMDVGNLYSYNVAMPVIFNRLFITGIVVIAAFVIDMLLLKCESAGSEKGIWPVRIFKLVVMVLAYFVPFLELNMQLKVEYFGFSSFRYVVLATFTTVYIAVLAIIYHKKVSSKGSIFGLLYSVVCLYAMLYSNLITDLRYDIFNISEGIYPAGYFSVHLMSLPAIGYVIYLLIKNMKSYSKASTSLSWLLTILVVVIFSVETDNLVVWMIGNPNNYDGTLYDVHTFGYPILWGIIAMVLMIWGLNKREALLRKISLVFFGLIIVKFYAYDVWKMSQAGRIISFVLLGVILLLVSFLQQKIRTLVKSDDKPENENQLKL